MSKDYRILVAIDLKTGTDRLLEEAQRYGQALNATVDIIHVAAPDPYFVGYIKGDPGSEENVDSGRDYHAKDLRLEHEQTQAFATRLRATGTRVGQVLTVQGPTLATVLEETRKLNADLLIIGSHHHGAIHNLWFGDTAADAAKQAPCALLVVPM
ncbi:MAG TPA: universal stress protein [Pseudolabrys sp.]